MQQVFLHMLHQTKFLFVFIMLFFSYNCTFALRKTIILPSNNMNIGTEDFGALSDEMSAKRLREMKDEIFRLESEVEQWKESANSCQMQVSMMREEPTRMMYEGCLVLSYDKLQDALCRISDFTFSRSLSTVMQYSLPDWATEEDSNKVAELIPLFPKMKKRMPANIQKIPNELRTEKALLLKEKLKDGGLIDKNWQPVNLSWSESALLAQMISDKLAIKDTWSVFGSLWNKNSGTLRAFYNRSLEQKKSLIFQDRLKRII